MSPAPVERRSVWSRVALVWFCSSTAALVWPVYPWLGNRVEPRVAGLPWSLVYVLLVIAANFLVLLALYGRRIVDARELGEDDDVRKPTTKGTHERRAGAEAGEADQERDRA
ncbi:MAG: hypothetical protein AAGF11_30300 [Myxococcota bacterium]